MAGKNKTLTAFIAKRLIIKCHRNPYTSPLNNARGTFHAEKYLKHRRFRKVWRVFLKVEIFLFVSRTWGLFLGGVGIALGITHEIQKFGAEVASDTYGNFVLKVFSVAAKYFMNALVPRKKKTIVLRIYEFWTSVNKFP